MLNKKTITTSSFCSYLLLLSNLYFILVVFFVFRYGSGVDILGSGYPFFGVSDRWNDFFNPIRYVWNLDPYAQPAGNSPPLMFAVAYIFSFPIRMGLSWETTYFIVYILAVLTLLFIQYKLAIRINGGGGGISYLHLFLITQTVVCFPIIYCFDRGNFVFVVSVVIAGAILAYHTEHYTLSAVLVGIAAALKLYPAILGIIFLADKKYRQAIQCTLTGILLSIAPLFLYHNGDIQYNLSNFLEKSKAYTLFGNGVVSWLVDDKNSFYQLFLIPYFLKNGQLVDPYQIPNITATAKIIITLFCVAAGLGCLVLKNNHDRFLILASIMLGYPIESGVYNLILFLVPFTYWCMSEKRNFVIPILGVLLITCKSVVVISAIPSVITLQAIMNPLCLLVIIVYIYFLRSRDISQKFRVFANYKDKSKRGSL